MQRLASLALLGLLVGCSADDDRPPVTGPCGGCAPPGQGTGTGAGGTSPDGAGGAGAEGGAAEVPSQFSVTRFESDDFLITAPFTGAAQLLGEREGGGNVRADWAGSGTVRLAPLTDRAFVLVTPADTTGDALPTLLRLPTTDADALELPLVRATVLDGILSLATVPLELLPNRAQVILELRDSRTRQPLSGAGVTAPSAEAIFYADGGTWSDAVEVTDPTGLVLFVNVAAADWPGELASITVTGPVAGSLPYRAVAGAVTVLRGEVP